jgi:hypothetical protein
MIEIAKRTSQTDKIHGKVLKENLFISPRLNSLYPKFASSNLSLSG